MIRVFWYIIKVALLIALAVWLANDPGRVTMTLQGYKIETSVGMLIFLAFLPIILTAIGYHFWKKIKAIPRNFRQSQELSRKEKGYIALTRGMVAVAAGDAKTAKAMALKAETFLNDEALTSLLKAQTAQLTGDQEAARTIYQEMLTRKATRTLGLRGLLAQAIKSGNMAQAREIADKAWEIEADKEWVQNTRLSLETQAENWAEAEEILTKALKQKNITQDDYNSQAAALMIKRSLSAEQQNLQDLAIKKAKKAIALRPNFAPAYERLAEIHLQEGNKAKARKVLLTAWSHVQHPCLLPLFDKAQEASTAIDQMKLYEKLVKSAPEAPLSHMAIAAKALEAHLWGKARLHLNAAISHGGEDPKIYHLFARLERLEHENEEAALEWEEKARDPHAAESWTCEHCGGLADHWDAVCPHCSLFNTLKWKIPTVSFHLPALSTDLVGDDTAIAPDLSLITPQISSKTDTETV